MENGEGCEMGGTSREGFLVPTSRRHFQDSDKNVNVISEDNYKAAHIIKYVIYVAFDTLSYITYLYTWPPRLSSFPSLQPQRLGQPLAHTGTQ